MMEDKSVYEAAVQVYLGFSEWRRKTLVGFITFLSLVAIAYSWLAENHKAQSWLAPALGAFGAVVLTMVECRTRWIIDNAEKAASKLEGKGSVQGFFTLLQATQASRRPLLSHGRVLIGSYVITAVVLGTLTLRLIP
jgi:hypothetical protein